MKDSGKNIRVSSDSYEFLRQNISPLIKLSKFVEQAIFEKIEREKKSEKVQYFEDFKSPKI